jgi:hypothetical protein
MCPLILPYLITKDGRTRARTRDSVNIRKIVLLATGGWWEKGNFDVVIHEMQEISANMGVDFMEPVIRPHAFLMESKGILTAEGAKVLENVKKAGHQLISTGVIEKELADLISTPLISEEDLRSRYNRALGMS